MFTLFKTYCVVPIERQIFLKEENSKLYRVQAYFLAKISTELPFAIITPLVNYFIKAIVTINCIVLLFGFARGMELFLGIPFNLHIGIIVRKWSWIVFLFSRK